jgi:hypothetical protein
MVLVAKESRQPLMGVQVHSMEPLSGIRSSGSRTRSGTESGGSGTESAGSGGSAVFVRRAPGSMSDWQGMFKDDNQNIGVVMTDFLGHEQIQFALKNRAGVPINVVNVLNPLQSLRINSDNTNENRQLRLVSVEAVNGKSLSVGKDETETKNKEKKEADGCYLAIECRGQHATEMTALFADAEWTCASVIILSEREPVPRPASPEISTSMFASGRGVNETVTGEKSKGRASESSSEGRGGGGGGGGDESVRERGKRMPYAHKVPSRGRYSHRSRQVPTHTGPRRTHTGPRRPLTHEEDEVRGDYVKRSRPESKSKSVKKGAPTAERQEAKLETSKISKKTVVEDEDEDEGEEEDDDEMDEEEDDDGEEEVKEKKGRSKMVENSKAAKLVHGDVVAVQTDDCETVFSDVKSQKCVLGLSIAPDLDVGLALHLRAQDVRNKSCTAALEKWKTILASRFGRVSTGIEKAEEKEDPPTKRLFVSEACVVCMDGPPDILFCECGHRCCHAKCSGRIETCPLCRQDILARLPSLLPS